MKIQENSTRSKIQQELPVFTGITGNIGGRARPANIMLPTYLALKGKPLLERLKINKIQIPLGSVVYESIMQSANMIQSLIEMKCVLLQLRIGALQYRKTDKCMGSRSHGQEKSSFFQFSPHFLWSRQQRGGSIMRLAPTDRSPTIPNWLDF